MRLRRKSGITAAENGLGEDKNKLSLSDEKAEWLKETVNIHGRICLAWSTLLLLAVVEKLRESFQVMKFAGVARRAAKYCAFLGVQQLLNIAVRKGFNALQWQCEQNL